MKAEWKEKEGGKLKEEERNQKLSELLLAWYDRSARVLPWRENPEPYRVWVSEIMLQQTRVEAVKPYYERFLRALPTVKDLAEAPEEQLLKLWEGLGYYNRVRNLQKGAQMVMERFGGEVPASFQELRSLPGVGDYTAGAIASIAFGLPAPAVDGNVLRVFSRLEASQEDILRPETKRRVEEEIRALLPKRVGDFNQSLMELGAMVCLPNGAPSCKACPLVTICEAYARGMQGELPVKTAKKPRRVEERTLFLLVHEEGGRRRIALRKRPKKGLLSGMWELPGVEKTLTEQEAEQALSSLGMEAADLSPLPAAKHIFTHVEWRMTAWRGKAAVKHDSFTWISEEELAEAYALPSAFKAYLPEIKKIFRG